MLAQKHVKIPFADSSPASSACSTLLIISRDTHVCMLVERPGYPAPCFSKLG
jgi:hypothetical protein